MGARTKFRGILLGRKHDIEVALVVLGGLFDADFLNLRGTMAGGRRGVGGWTWTRNKRFITDALASGAEIRLVTDPDALMPAGGNTFQRELKFLRDLGCRWVARGDHWVVLPVR